MDFAFGKNGTHTGDIDWLVSFDKPVNVVDVFLYKYDHHLDEASGAAAHLSLIIKSTTFSPLSSRIALQS